MTGIADYICDEVFTGRLSRSAVLVVYDPHRRYRELCLSLASEAVVVVDASESSIDSREAAILAFVSLGRGEPRSKGVADLCSQPSADQRRGAPGRSLRRLYGLRRRSSERRRQRLSQPLRKAKPDHATEIRRLFEQDASPSFTLIDNVGGGLQWPTLRTRLQAESARDILFVLLVPSLKQEEALQDNETWIREAWALLGATLGLKLITRLAPLVEANFNFIELGHAAPANPTSSASSHPI